MQRLMLSLLATGIVAGYLGTRPAESAPATAARQAAQCAPLTGEQRQVVGAVRSLMNDRRLSSAYANMLQAAYAELAALPADVPEAGVYRARLLRLLGRPQDAEAEYQGLLGSCRAADGWQGLGQLALQRGDVEDAAADFESAMALEPQNASIRADLGNAYLQRRDLALADAQLNRALELDPGNRAAVASYATLLVYRNETSQARRLVSRQGLGSEVLAQAEQRAARMRVIDAGQPAVAASEAVAANLPVEAVDTVESATEAPEAVAAALPVAAAPEVQAVANPEPEPEFTPAPEPEPTPEPAEMPAPAVVAAAASEPALPEEALASSDVPESASVLGEERIAAAEPAVETTPLAVATAPVEVAPASMPEAEPLTLAAAPVNEQPVSSRELNEMPTPVPAVAELESDEDLLIAANSPQVVPMDEDQGADVATLEEAEDLPEQAAVAIVEPAPAAAPMQSSAPAVPGRFVVSADMPVPVVGQPVASAGAGSPLLRELSGPQPVAVAPAPAPMPLPAPAPVTLVAVQSGSPALSSMLQSTPERSVSIERGADGSEVIRIRSESPLRVLPPESVPIIRD